MESTPKLFHFLNLPVGFQTNFEENRLKYKHIFVDERHRYIQELDTMFDDFRLDYQKDKQSVNPFDLLVQITDIIDKLTNYYYDDVLWFKPVITELPELAEYERLEKKKYHDNQLDMLEPTIEYEIRIAKKIKYFIVKQNSSGTVEGNSTTAEQQSPTTSDEQASTSAVETTVLKEKVYFEDEQNTLIAFFYTLWLMKKITFGNERKYTTEQKHFEDFLKKNFKYKRGLTYHDVVNVEKALSVLRMQYTPTADIANDNILSMIDDGITYLTSYKERLDTVSIRPKVKE